MVIMPDELPLEAKADELEGAFRKIGLYFNQARWLSPGKPEDQSDPDAPYVEEHRSMPDRNFLIVDALVGDVAFSKRVQTPEQVDIDTEFSKMTREYKSAEALELQEKIRKAVAAGEDPFAEASDD